MTPSNETPRVSRNAPSPELFIQGSSMSRKRDSAAMLGVDLDAQENFHAAIRQSSNSRPPPPAPPNKAKKPRPNFSKPDAELVTIFVGPQQEKFRTHRHVITHDSKFFRDAFNRQTTADGETKILILKDVDAKVFGLYNNWSYSQVIEHAPDSLDNGPAKRPELMELAQLWTCAGAWKVPALQNQAMRKLIPLVMTDTVDIGKDAVIWQFLKLAYSTREFTPLKRLAVEKMSRFASMLVPLRDWVGDFPEGFLPDFTEVLLKKVMGMTVEDDARSRPLMSAFLVRDES